MQEIKNLLKLEDFFNKCQYLLDQKHPLVCYGKSLLLFELKAMEKSLELLETSKNRGLQKFNMKSEEFDEILNNKINEIYQTTKLEIVRIGEVEQNLQKLYSCHVCQRQFSKSFTLKRHLKSHFGEKNYICNDCGHAFIQKSDLKRHLTSHESSYNNHCTYPECHKKFKTIKNLRNHLKTHSTEQFDCLLCGRIFKTQKYLKLHSLQHGEKNYFCEICSKEFTSEARVKSHMNVHNNEKKFVCSKCPNRYKRLCDLRHHSKNSHGNNFIDSSSSSSSSLIVETARSSTNFHS